MRDYKGKKGNKDIRSELRKIENEEIKVKKGLEDVKREEGLILTKFNRYLDKEKIISRKAYLEVMHFTFNDFAQAIIGSCVFSFAPFLDTDPWGYLPIINTKFLFSIHLFFVFCVFIALNYEFRNNFKLDFWFLKLLLKRLFYIYFSVLMVMCLIVIMINRINYQTSLLDVSRNLLAIQSVGLLGAVTFSFLKK